MSLPEGETAAPACVTRSGRIRYGRRALIIGLEILATLVTGLLLGVGLLLWRVSYGPLNLTFLTPYIERALNPPGAGVRTTIGSSALSLIGGQNALGVLARDVEVRPTGSTSTTAPTVRVPELGVSLGLGALLRGTLVPAEVSIAGASLSLIRESDGNLSLGLEGPEPQGWPPGQLLAPAGSDPGPLGRLSKISVTDSRLQLQDRRSGHLITVTVDSLTATRYRGDISGAAQLHVGLGGQQVGLNLEISYAAAAARLGGRLQLDRLDPSLLATEMAAPAELAALHVPVSGTLSGALDLRTGTLDRLTLVFQGGAGTIVSSAFADGALPIKAFHVAASYDPVGQRLVAEQLSLDLGSSPSRDGKSDARPGPRLRAALTVAGIHPNQLQLAALSPATPGGVPPAPEKPAPWLVSGDAEVSGIAMDRVAAYWPESMAANARAWIVPNVTAGNLDDLKAGFRLKFDPAQPGATTIEQLSGSYRYRGLTVNYFRPLPPLFGVDGSATFDRTRMDLTPVSGRVGAITLADGKVSIEQFEAPQQVIGIDVTLVGSIRDQLRLIDLKPLQFLKRLGQSADAYDGEARTHMSLHFPLIKNLKTETIALAVEAQLHRVGISRAALDRDISEGEASLNLDTHHLTLSGTAKLAGVPARVEWLQNFSESAAFGSRYQVRGTVDDVQRHALGIDLPPDFVQGPIGVDLFYTSFPHGRSRIQASLDLGQAALAVESAGWRKPAGLGGTARVLADFLNQHPVSVGPLLVEAPGLWLAGDLAFAADGGIAAGHVTRLAIGQTQLSGGFRQRAGGGWKIAVSGAELDAAPLLRAGEKTATDRNPSVPLDIALEADHLILGPGREFRHVALQALLDQAGIEDLRCEARIAPSYQGVAPRPLDGRKVAAGRPALIQRSESAQLRLALSDAAHGHRFSVETSDLGATLSGLSLTDHVRGGRASLVGQLTESSAGRVWRGRASSDAFTVVGVGAFARLLSLASLSGIASLLEGEGIPFSRLEGAFTLSGDHLAVSDARAYGGAMGINVSGEIERAAGTVDLTGTLAPAYSINSLLGAVPLLGPALLGGQGQGLFAANFTLTGLLDEPRISVNPLSIFAPGFLRKLFLFDAGGSPAPKPTPPAAPR